MKALLLLPVLFLSGCATLKKATEPKIEKSVTVQIPFDKAWAEIISHFTEKGVPVKTLEKASGLVATDDMKFTTTTDSKFFICDEQKALGVIVPREGLAKFNVFVKKVSEKETTVQVNTFATVSNYQPGSQFTLVPISCYSSGENERLLIERLKQIK